MTAKPSPPVEPEGRLQRLGRFVLTLLPVGAVTAMAVAAVNHGLVRAAWTLAAIAATLATTVLAARKDREVSAARATAVAAKADLATALTTAGQPLIAALGNVAAASTPENRRTAIEVLRQSTISIARSQTGKNTKEKCAIRAVLYEFDGEILRRKNYQGRPGDVPREDFRPERGRNDQGVIELARGEQAVLFDDLDNTKPHYFSDRQGRSYKSAINVPIRAERQSFGLLCIDSDQPKTLTEVDKGYAILLAGVLAAGLAHQDCKSYNDHHGVYSVPDPREPVEPIAGDIADKRRE